MGRKACAWLPLATAAALALVAGSCKREQRGFHEIPPASMAADVAVSDLHPGGGNPPERAITPYEQNAYALSEGKRLFSAYNCTGCHANGGGGMGPALIDDQWAYGHEADQIYRSILEGRPNGMPAWRGKIPDYQIWQLTAYIRSMSGLAPKDASPNRSDHMSGKPAESSSPRMIPKNAGTPPGAVR